MMRRDKSRGRRKTGAGGLVGWRSGLFLAAISAAFIMWCPAPRGLTDEVSAQTSEPTAVAGVEWAQSYNGPANCCEQVPKLALDPQGNVYITGQSTTTRVSPSGTFNDDITTIKYDSRGNEMWVRRFGGAGNSTDVPSDIAADARGNVYVTGYTAGDDSQYVTLKYDADGNLLWAREAGSPLYDYALALDVDGQGNVYVTGREAYRFKTGNTPVYQFLTVKYDADGNEIWQRTFDTPQQQGAEAADVKADQAGNVYVTGKGYAPDGTKNNGYDIFTIKYDAHGNEQWVREFGGGGPEYYNNDTASKLHLDGQGNAYVLGSTTRGPNQSDVLVLKYTTGGDFIRAILSNHPDNELSSDWAFDDAGNIYVLALKIIPRPDYSLFVLDVVTSKFDAAGGLVWRNLYASSGGGNDYGRGIVLDGAGGVYVGVDAQQGTTFNENYILVKYRAPDGTRESEKSYDGPANDRDRLFGIAIDRAGNIYLTGESQTDSATGHSVDYLTLKVASTLPAPRPRPEPPPPPAPPDVSDGKGDPLPLPGPITTDDAPEEATPPDETTPPGRP